MQNKKPVYSYIQPINVFTRHNYFFDALMLRCDILQDWLYHKEFPLYKKKMIKRQHITFLLCIFIPLLVSADESQSLCTGDEALIFECSLGEQQIALCASHPQDEIQNHVQYRVGTPDSIEWVYPAIDASPEGLFYFASTAYSGGGASHIRFNDKETEYFIFDTMFRTHYVPDEPNYPVFMAGLVTRQQDVITSIYLCEDGSASIRSPAYTLFERESFDASIIPSPLNQTQN